MAPNVLVLGTADWDAPIATNQHFVARELARMANVYFVESLGLRRPTLGRDDLGRMAKRLRRAVGGAQPQSRRARPQRTRIISPVLVPLHRTPTRAVNRALLRCAAAPWLRTDHPRVLWAFSPVTYGLEEDADIVVYHCVDLLAAVAGVDGVAVEQGERNLASRTKVAIATSMAVLDHLLAVGFPRVELLPNVADVSTFAGASSPSADRRPAALFAGNLTEHKLDLPLLEAIARAVRGRGELILAGPLSAGGGDFRRALVRLEALGARHVGLLDPAELAKLAGTCSVGLIPYRLNDYTRGVSPLKCYEYLSSGLGVVSTRLPEVDRLAHTNEHVVAAESADLVPHVLRWLDPPTDDVISARMASAEDHGWEGRGAAIRQLLSAAAGS